MCSTKEQITNSTVGGLETQAFSDAKNQNRSTREQPGHLEDPEAMGPDQKQTSSAFESKTTVGLNSQPLVHKIGPEGEELDQNY